MSDAKKLLQSKLSQYKKEGIHRVKLGFTDVDGIMRGKYLSLDKFKSLIKAGHAGFCDCVFGWDSDDQLYDNVSFTGWHTAFPDALYRVDPNTERRLKDEGNIPFFIAEFINEDQSLHDICPRSRLKHVLNRATDAGFSATLAFEYEFFIFNETAHSVREKNYQNLTPLSPGNFGYSVLRTNILSDLFNEFMDYCADLNCPLEGLHCETGPGVWEGALAKDDALSACDKAILFKTFAKSFFQKKGLIATFMAKWSMDYPGQSGHCHQSLQYTSSNQSAFYDDTKPHHISDTMGHYVAGLQRYLKPMLSLSAPTINSYTRLVKGAWAPTTATWGVENRTCALRVIPGTDSAQRVEYRIGSADANPYLVAAATIGSGLSGIEQKLQLDDPITGNAYDIQDQLANDKQLATNLLDASRELQSSQIAREILGDAFVDHYANSRQWEVREYQRFVNDWQLKRYFEII